jgi:hypothetical protein
MPSGIVARMSDSDIRANYSRMSLPLMRATEPHLLHQLG